MESSNAECCTPIDTTAQHPNRIFFGKLPLDVAVDASKSRPPAKSDVQETPKMWIKYDYPLVISDMTMENGPFIVDVPIQDGDFTYFT